jgi:phosphatidate cytidylyltransferase
MSTLKTWSADQQVALLFVILFGVLLLASAAVALLTLRERSGAQLDQHDRLRRELGAVWAGAVVFWAAWVSGPVGATVLFGVVSFLALREYVTLVKTRRGDHRSLLLAFFGVLPLQYVLVANRNFDLFSVFIPVYVFLAIPVVSALAGDPQRFLERNAKIQWGIMVCIYGLGHAPALVLLDFPGHGGRGAFLLFFLVVVTVGAQLAQTAASRRLRRRPVARHIDRSFSLRAWGIGIAAGAALGWRCSGSRRSSRARPWPWPPSPRPPARWANW